MSAVIAPDRSALEHSLALDLADVVTVSSGRRRHVALTLLRQPLALCGVLFVGLALVAAVGAPWLAPHDPLQADVTRQFIAPFTQRPFLLGTDDLGRDLLSRTIFGTRLSLISMAVILGLSVPFGVAVGAVAGFWGGWVQTVLMRITDIFLAFPSLVLALAVAAVLGPSAINAMLAVSVVWWPWYARLARGQVLGVRHELYVEAATALGVSRAGVLWRHILPQILTPVIVLATLDVGNVVLAVSGLSFIGLGAQPPTPELGAMVSNGRQFMLTDWWVPTIPGIGIFIIVLGANLLGDAVRDLLDPRGRDA